MNYIKVLSLSLVIWITACNSEEKNQQGASLPESLEIEKIQLTELNGNPIDLRQYEGKTIFLNFWATWCQPCMQEMPSIANAKNLLEKEPIMFLFASNESLDLIAEFSKNHDYDFKYVRIENMEDLLIDVLPTTYIFSPGGKLLFSESGFKKWDEKTNLDILVNTIHKK